MAVLDMTGRFRRAFRGAAGNREPDTQVPEMPVASPSGRASQVQLDIAPNDPIVAYFQSTAGPVEIENLRLDSPALRSMVAAGIQLVVPLISQGELVGLLGLGARLSEQGYSADDRGLLGNLASQAAPAARVAQLVRQQQAEALARERIENELRLPHEIQQTLLPKSLPDLPGWQIDTHYQPAREVGGDFYDFIYLPDGLIGIVVGDVTDKGVPAALVMATTRSVLRAAAGRLISPGEVLARVNDAMCPDIPARMFVTCLYAVLDPVSGHMVYANAGHDPPYCCGASGVRRLWAAGMPLGLLPGMTYDEAEAEVGPGDRVVLYSDGLVEAHDRGGAMFGFPKLEKILAEQPRERLIGFLLDRLGEFVGQDWEQEDDVTLVTLHRFPGEAS